MTDDDRGFFDALEAEMITRNHRNKLTKLEFNQFMSSLDRLTHEQQVELFNTLIVRMISDEDRI